MKEIIKFTLGQNNASQESDSIVNDFLNKNPHVSFLEVDDLAEPEIRRHILASAGPTVYPCYVGIVDGNIVNIMPSIKDGNDVSALLGEI